MAGIFAITAPTAAVLPSLLLLLFLLPMMLLLLPVFPIAPPAPRGRHPGGRPSRHRSPIFEGPPAAARLIPQEDLRGGRPIRRIGVINARGFSAQLARGEHRRRMLWRGRAKPHPRVPPASAHGAFRGRGRGGGVSLAVRRVASLLLLLLLKRLLVVLGRGVVVGGNCCCGCFCRYCCCWVGGREHPRPSGAGGGRFLAAPRAAFFPLRVVAAQADGSHKNARSKQATTARTTFNVRYDMIIRLLL